MKDHRLPYLGMLEATPGILRALMCELSNEDARWKPTPGRFSVAEVLAACRTPKVTATACAWTDS
jgi:hypothetical protein